MNIAISGASGYLGKELTSSLGREHKVIIVTRSDLSNEINLHSKLRGADVCIILNGYPIIKRWTKKNKNLIFRSRIHTIECITNCIDKYNIKLNTLITASAIGAYNNYDFNNENAGIQNKFFLHELIQKWENTSSSRYRHIKLRIGVVIGKESPYINKIKLNLNLGFNFIFGSNAVPFSFISINNFKKAIIYIIDNQYIEGVINLVEPYSFSQKIFMNLLKPNNINLVIPRVMIKIIFGKAGQLLYEGQKVIPEKLLINGFKFEPIDFKSILAR